MNDVIEQLAVLFEPSWKGLVNVIDILLVAFVIFRLLKLVRGTRAWRVVMGIGVFVVALALSDTLGLRTLHWILDKATLLAPVALVILFLPELRQALDGFARFGIWSDRLIGGESDLADGTLEEIVKAAEELAQSKTGALIVIERSNRLDDVAQTGSPVHGLVTAPLLGAIFYEGNPLHDGAVLIRDKEVLAAACRLPLSESSKIGAQYHMRHRAGLGVSEQSDCVVLIVSEERGSISLAVDGEHEVLRSAEALRNRLTELLQTQRATKKRLVSPFSSRRKGEPEPEATEAEAEEPVQAGDPR